MTRNADQLRSIQTFEELIPFLEDDLDWPFPHGSQEYEFDDLTFEYTPDELGLEEEYAAKIKRIHQLRPLVSGQPWGIFFVEFENKKLPIVVLRRILSHLVLKQRKSANPADRARWNAGDLLFISAFAEEGTLQREIAFAHFHQDPGDQPTLRVLGWDGGDTPLKLEHVSQILKHRLSWPSHPSDHAAWRRQWAGAFRHSIGQQIRTADLLAQELARVARNIRDAAMALMKVESSRGPLRRMHEAFQIALIHDLTQEGFADTYAQTITYGLLTAAISRTDRTAGAEGTFVLAEDVHNMVPITNPFLKEMLESFLKVGGRSASTHPGLDFDELGVQNVVELLRSSQIDLPAVLEDFGNKNPGEDPVIRFYEDFLEAYNKELKIKRGVFYTPQPVVSYIVHSVHEILQRDFGLPEGLASTITWREMIEHSELHGRSLVIPEGVPPDSPFVVILDPATGTATFLVETIDLIYRTMKESWTRQSFTSAQQADAWNRYVPEHLLPRLFGYELLMAPYAIAHMKMGLKLHETGYDFNSDERVRIYLTNALVRAGDVNTQISISDWMPALAHEAEAVHLVKSRQRFTVIIGNPPYPNYSANLDPQARALVDRYRMFRGSRIRERNQLQFERNLQDDFVKFIAIGQGLLEQSQCGVLGYITNATMLASNSLRGLREDLLRTFTFLYELNLHGGVNELFDENTSDENVFDIAQAVAIHLYTLGPWNIDHSLYYASLVGTRNHKYTLLSEEVAQFRDEQRIVPDLAVMAFIPQDAAAEIDPIRLDSLFNQYGGGVKTDQDGSVIGFDDSALQTSVRALNEDLADQFADHVQSILYRPFDIRRIFYHQDVVASRSYPTMRHVLAGKNIGFVTSSTWTTAERFSVGVAITMVEMKSGTHDRGTTFFPLYRYETLLGSAPQKICNLTNDCIQSWKSRSGLHFMPVGKGDLISNSGPEDLFHWLYALFYSPEYRRRYRSALANRFPIVLFSSNTALIRDLVRLGESLVLLHLMKEEATGAEGPSYFGPSLPYVNTVLYENGTVYLNATHTAGFRGITQEVWNFYFGGYPVCYKWLKDRKTRALSSRDINHYRNIALTISGTIRVMEEIDQTIEMHGGWAQAFV